jgi:hypothetical protein
MDQLRPVFRRDSRLGERPVRKPANGTDDATDDETADGE